MLCLPRVDRVEGLGSLLLASFVYVEQCLRTGNWGPTPRS